MIINCIYYVQNIYFISTCSTLYHRVNKALWLDLPLKHTKSYFVCSFATRHVIRNRIAVLYSLNQELSIHTKHDVLISTIHAENYENTIRRSVQSAGISPLTLLIVRSVRDAAFRLRSNIRFSTYDFYCENINVALMGAVNKHGCVQILVHSD